MEKMIKIKSKIENLREVEKFIDDITAELNLSNEIYGNILISVLEAAKNAIVHGNKNDISKNVEIKVRKEKENLDFFIKDEGNGFDFNTIPDPTAPENIEKVNGRGVFLMKKLSDDIEFKEEGRLVKITFNT